MTHRRRHILAAAPRMGAMAMSCALVLSGCMTQYDEQPRFTALEAARIPAPAGAPAGSCWAQDVTPAVIETVTAQVMVSPPAYAADGSVVAPASYATETRQQIVKEREIFEFETVCPAEITPQFIASLQRALQARAIYFHEITGQFDPATDAALRYYQFNQGRNTGILTIETAREFGLAPAIWR
ncbi:peptidoglycan-binding domain-containing protein [Roseobacteraceae bacterium S113]